jgi:hypothetical protein
MVDGERYVSLRALREYDNIPKSNAKKPTKRKRRKFNKAKGIVKKGKM